MGRIKKVLITGGSGFIARNLYSHLNSLPYYEPWTLSRQKNSSTRTITANITELADIGENLDEHTFDTVIHVAAFIPTPEHAAEKENCQKVNFDGTYNLIELFQSEIKQFVYLSSLAVFNGFWGDTISEASIPCPVSDYGNSKLAGEYLCNCLARKYDVELQILRLGTVYGRYMNESRMIYYLMKNALENNDLDILNESTPLNTVYIDDVISTIEQLLHTEGGLFHLAVDALTKKELVETIIAVTNSKSIVTYSGNDSDTHLKTINIEKLLSHISLARQHTLEQGLKRLMSFMLELKD